MRMEREAALSRLREELMKVDDQLKHNQMAKRLGLFAHHLESETRGKVRAHLMHTTWHDLFMILTYSMQLHTTPHSLASLDCVKAAGSKPPSIPEV